ncbi:DUF7940 domain-containing protein [Aminobacter niigataensis]|uniref:DUF7940 domain-containing protein n=1 Tax=Aminobacter niigataensis TaxID=83265 RepID=UPI0024C966B1|nr:hypothetical protein [Aminobacter niigataensis]CAI2936170.1 conserved protein of unknown function [Aminobacter niigataensis]
MKLVANWRAVLRHAWTVRLLVLACLLTATEVALPLLDGLLPVPPGVFALLSGLTSAGALAARFIAQQKISGDDQ